MYPCETDNNKNMILTDEIFSQAVYDWYSFRIRSKSEYKDGNKKKQTKNSSKACVESRMYTSSFSIYCSYNLIFS